MSLTGHAIYDFEANEEHGELSLKSGQVVTIFRQVSVVCVVFVFVCVCVCLCLCVCVFVFVCV